MSQRFGFTPSLAAPEPTVDEDYRSDEDENYDDIKKSLFGGFEVEAPVQKTQKESVQVYLRVRPRNNTEIQQRQAECFHFKNGGQEVLAIPPRTSQAYKSKTGTHHESKYTFTKVFGPESTQTDVFEESLFPSIKDFLDGQNYLIFTYGVTNSGKTFTVSGTPSNPGLLPRLLDVVFNSVQDGQLLTDSKFKPKHFSEVSYLTEEELAAARALKETLMARAVEVDQTPTPVFPGLDETDTAMSDHDISTMSTISKVSSNVSKLSADEGISFEMPVHESTTIDLDDSGHFYSVWVTYAEIYNEFIYDLLDEPPVKGKPRHPLKLQEDRNHNLFIRGLREIQVSTVEEAMLLLKYGLKYRSQAATRLNYNSSRSHAVYTVKIVKVANPDKPNSALVNRVSIVDLAGAERSSKTGASGARVKEAGQINKSLLTLGKCIDAMKHNQQKKGEDQIVPFRESKLTRLFQNYFVGKGGREARQGKVTMYVNISNVASVFDETLHVLRFSALTSKVIPLVKSLPGPTPRKPKSNLPPPTPSTLTRSTRTRTTRRHGLSEEDQESNSSTDSGECSNCKALEELVNSVRSQLKEQESNLREQEYRVRQEVCKEFNEQLIEIEDNHTRELELQADEIEEMYEKRIKNLQKSMKRQYTRKRRRQEDDDQDDEDPVERLRAKVERLEDKNRELEEELELERERAAAEVRDAAESHETRVVTLNQHLSDKCFELLERNKELSTVRSQLEALQSEMTELRESDKESVLFGQVADLKGKLSTSENCVDDALAEVEILTLRISELTSEKDEMEAGKRDTEEKLREALEQSSTDDSERCATLQEQVVALETQLCELKQQLVSTQSQLNSLTKEHTQQMNELEAEKAALATAKDEWQAERVAHTSDKESWEREKTDWQVEREAHATAQAAWEIQRSAHIKEKEDWELERATLTRIQVEKASVQTELLQGSADKEVSLATELAALKMAHSSDRQAWEQQMETLNKAYSEEKENLKTEMGSLRRALDKERSDCTAEASALKSTHASELEAMQSAYDNKVTSLKAELASLKEACANAEQQVQTLSHNQSDEKATAQRAFDEKMGSLNEAHLREKTSWEHEVQGLKNEVNSVSAQVVVKNEQIYKMESEKEALTREVVNLKHSLEDRLAEISELTSQKDTLSLDVTRTLKEYETTLKNQTALIQELKSENEVVMAQNEELTQQCSDMEIRRNRTSAAKEALSSRVDELTNSLEDSRKALSQRESELLDTSDQCRAVLEEQIADLRKSCATLEHQLTTVREDNKTLQAALSEKESELLSLAKSVGGDKAEVESVTSQLQDLTNRHQQLQEEHEKHLSELKGNHQLEVAQYTIRLRELGEELEAKRGELENMGQSYESEVETVRAEWDNQVQGLNKKLQQAEKKLNNLAVIEAELKSVKKSSQQLKKDCESKKKEIATLDGHVNSLEDTLRSKDQELLKIKISHETAIQGVKDEWRREVSEVKEAIKKDVKDPTYEELPEAPSEDQTIYDSVCDSSGTTITSTEAPPTYTTPTTVLKPIDSIGNSRRSYLRAVTSSSIIPETENVFETSKPNIPILETSSQLEEDTSSSDSHRVEIDATPLPLRKKKRPLMSRKRSINQENEVASVKKGRYMLRGKSKKVKEEDGSKPKQETDSLQNFTPRSKSSFIKRFPTTSKKKKASVAEPEPEYTAIATRTRRGRLRKNEISAPIECINSPANV